MARRFFPQLISMILLLTALVLTGCRDKKPIYLGYAGPLTGKFADLGIAGRDGVVLAVEEINAGGGIAGREIELLSKDDAQDPQQAQKVDQELVDAGAVAVIGHMTSVMSVAGLPVVNRAHLVMLSPTTSSNDLTGIDDYFLRVYPPSSQVAHLLSTHAIEKLDIRSISVVYDISNEAHTLGWYKYFRENHQRLGGRIVQEFPFKGGKADFSHLAEQIKAGGSQGLFIIAGAMDTAMICQHLRRSGFGMPIVVSEWSTTDELLSQGGTAVEGINFYQTFDRNSDQPAYVAFRKNYRERFRREPTFASVHAYDSAKLVFSALTRDSDPKKLKQTILSMANFNGLQDQIMIDRFGDPKRTPFLMVIKNGTFQRVR
ncbi:ABC transporter, periplasmic substrate-binding lipoprotein, putative [Geotalea daltonii FRC-32]|uniref:ABC transporter, periplasmic substrate-binding lipoprotein, putative n=1 Tax=Geotalea daltonii (strain DSM 22248 / JCM 15807 / FRC-32) TaxID=316067 RepID=B9M5M6_GEODF|nr:ABC transporter substrate-binding protein [Geotalea daltonii]ACM21785.1 ABC transporter, periplasmic substrate-binding lipoprotein, putative [Geotalea daltonii FRC-32]